MVKRPASAQSARVRASTGSTRVVATQQQPRPGVAGLTTRPKQLSASADSGAVLLEADSAAEGPASERSYEESTLRSLPPHLADPARAGASGDGGLLSDLQEEALRLSDERDALLRTGVYTPGDEVGASCFLPSLPALHSPHLWPSN